METYKKYLIEGYTKKTAVSNSSKIGKELYQIIKNNEVARTQLGHIMANDIKPGMFKIAVEKGQSGLDKPPSDYYRRTGKKMGRKSFRLYDYIVIRWYDSFWKDYSRKYFSTAKKFNAFLDKMNQYKELENTD